MGIQGRINPSQAERYCKSIDTLLGFVKRKSESPQEATKMRRGGSSEHLKSTEALRLGLGAEPKVSHDHREGFSSCNYRSCHIKVLLGFVSSTWYFAYGIVVNPQPIEN